MDSSIDFGITAEQAKQLAVSSAIDPYMYRKTKLIIVTEAKKGNLQVSIPAARLSLTSSSGKTMFDKYDGEVFKQLQKEGCRVEINRRAWFDNEIMEVATISWK